MAPVTVEPKSGIRHPRQARSSAAQEQLVKATVEALSQKGIARLTHRDVARHAGMSLAATTYYYESKAAMVADASGKLLRSYIDSFRKALHKYHVAPDNAPTFEEFFAHLLVNGVDRHGDESVAWCEIMLDAARGGESRQLARQWYGELLDVWSDLSRALHGTLPQAHVRNVIDTFAGILFMVAALAPDNATLANATKPGFAFGHLRDKEKMTEEQLPIRDSRKARETRERILTVAMELLVEDGPSAIAYRPIAERSRLSLAAPAYYFGSIDLLLHATQSRLFQASKDRYRKVMAQTGQQALDIDRLVDLTNVIFQREATEYARENTACLSVSLEATRNLSLRPLVRQAIADQAIAWRRVLSGLVGAKSTIGDLVPPALFLGKLLRVLALGSQNAELVLAREDFMVGISAMRDGKFFMI